ncbi:MAG: hypothetical protein ABIQ99_19130 [Thermoflexales bacterium]
MTHKLIRIGVGAAGIASILAAIALFFRWPIVADIWPWTGPYATLSPLSLYFLSSIAAAVGAPVLWIAISDKLYAAAPGASNLLIAFIGIAVFMFQGFAAEPSNSRLLQSALLVSASAIANVVIYLAGRKMPDPDRRPLPALVRYSYFVFITALIIVGGQLILKIPGVLPWDISVEASVVYGWIFLGASVYFTYAVVRSTWGNAAGQLLGFLAYDVVLILPFIRHFSAARPEQIASLIVYTIVVVYSGLLAIYYLFINRETRIIAGAAVK